MPVHYTYMYRFSRASISLCFQWNFWFRLAHVSYIFCNFVNVYHFTGSLFCLIRKYRKITCTVFCYSSSLAWHCARGKFPYLWPFVGICGGGLQSHRDHPLYQVSETDHQGTVKGSGQVQKPGNLLYPFDFLIVSVCALR